MMTTYKIVIVGTIEADSQEDAEGVLIHELLPWENIDTANFNMMVATAEPLDT